MPFSTTRPSQKTPEIDSLAALLELEKKFQGKEWAFRGIPGHRGEAVALRDLHDLETTLEKVAAEFGVQDVPWLEKTLIIEFVRRYHLYHVATPPRPGDTLEWLALMAHYGAPTRFLDFTYSLPIAAFFALERAEKRRRGARGVENSLSGTARIWAVDKTWLTQTVKHLYGAKIEKNLKAYAVTRDGNAFRRLFFRRPPLAFVAPVSGFRLNERLTVQQGLFLCPGDVRKSFAHNLRVMEGDKSEDHLKVIYLKRDAREQILLDLYKVNIHRATLFPGLDGFAASLWTRVPSLKQLLARQKVGSRLAEQDFAADFERILRLW
jgi:hypothetical protein